MPRETKDAKAARLRKITAGLKRAYPDAHCELDHTSPLELLIATILSAQCTDKRVNIVTADLFRKYRSAADYARASQAELEQDIKTTGFFRNKAKSIQSCCQALVEKHGGQVPRTMDELTQLGGVGRKTANVVLGHAFGVPGLPVDRHVLRVAGRIGIARGDDPVAVEAQLCEALPRRRWTVSSDTLILHGRRVCKPKPLCDRCAVRGDCEHFRTTWGAQPAAAARPAPKRRRPRR